jgi:hypothetical protein
MRRAALEAFPQVYELVLVPMISLTWRGPACHETHHSAVRPSANQASATTCSSTPVGPQRPWA